MTDRCSRFAASECRAAMASTQNGRKQTQAERNFFLNPLSIASLGAERASHALRM
jgi:hypothetical protein